MSPPRRAATALLPLVLGIGHATADDLALDYTVDVTTVSTYVWRGERMSTRPLAPAAQPYLEIGIAPIAGGRLAIGTWTSAFLTGADPAYEVDPYLSYAAPWGPATVTAGYAVYFVTESTPAASMHEASLQVAVDSLPVVPSAGVAVDFVRTDGGYAWAALDHELALGPATVTTRLEVGASAYAALAAGFQHATLTSRGALPLGRGSYVAATGALAYGGRSQQWAPTFAISVGVSR